VFINKFLDIVDSLLNIVHKGGSIIHFLLNDSKLVLNITIHALMKKIEEKHAIKEVNSTIKKFTLHHIIRQNVKQEINNALARILLTFIQMKKFITKKHLHYETLFSLNLF
jgi:hypothetical protein